MPFTRFLAVLLLASTAACSTSMNSSKAPPLQTVSHVDLPRFMGDWYIIAHIPYALEKGKVGTVDRYQLRPDGKIDNYFLYRKKTLDAPVQEWKSLAWVHDKKTNAEWRVQLLWPFRVSYLIVDLDPNYQWGALGYPSRKLGWVISRKPTLDEKTYQEILQRLKAKGYDTTQFVKVPQTPLN